MLHILLLILKIIGIIIAAILGILVLTVCVVLFVPVRYHAEASCDSSVKDVRARARATWFLHLIGLHISYENRELSWQVRIAWKKIRSGQEGKNTIKAEVETYDKEVEELWEDFEDNLEEEPRKGYEEGPEGREDRSSEYPEEEKDKHMEEPEESSKEIDKAVEKVFKEPEELLARLEQEMERILEDGKDSEETQAYDPGIWGDAHEECCEEREEACEEQEADPAGDGQEEAGEEQETDFEDGWEETDEERETDSEDSQEERDEDDGVSEEERKHLWQKITGICQKLIQKVTGLYQKIAGIPGKIKETVNHICDKIKILLEKRDKILDFITDEVHKKAFLKVKEEGIRLLGKLKPKRLQGKIRYGFEDPYLTGKVLAGFALAYPFIGGCVEVDSDFEQRILKGRLEIAGRLRVSYFVKLLWNLVWCREVRMTYRHAREFRL